ncbi:MAG: hypothetical protein II948_07820 [Synergistaceae bacterium]|nr:hypothetical protein [Synergistaceae bacterium]MBQ4419004.1 hypothetical protein [Synergistaceae bacterium]MBR0097303.1 hypothetical protein [Synergistaceae bacterium]MBR0221838.1 hypothetical protein [Synergistaceae bacterium]
MNEKTLIFPVLFPALAALLIHVLKFKSRGVRNIFIELCVIFNSFLLGLLIYNPPLNTLIIFRISEGAAFAFKIDGLGMVFSGLIALLWPLTGLYAFEYMKHESEKHNLDDNAFFSWFVLTFGVVAGIALSANLLTLYLFYEIMTLTTLPLVMYAMDGRARYAGRKYLIYSVGGAALGFIALAFALYQGGGGNFVLGGTLGVWPQEPSNMLLSAYLLGFIGFGVKAAVFPFHGWLPSASVAPTPVTALLHAVAVVKAGIFSIIRLTWYVFEPEALMGTWAHTAAFLITCATIIYGSSMALATQHFKRRFAYSTISQLSYILMGALLLTPEGLTGALMHMGAHAVMKINLFFCAGAVLCQTEREYLFDMRGIGLGMPKTFIALLISGLALCGLPPTAGFVGKWQLGIAAAASNTLGHVGLAALAISSVLTVLYIFSIFSIAIMPGKNFDFKTANKGVRDPGLDMLLPMGILALGAVIYGLYAENLLNFFSMIAVGEL